MAIDIVVGKESPSLTPKINRYILYIISSLVILAISISGISAKIIVITILLHYILIHETSRQNLTDQGNAFKYEYINLFCN